MNPITGEGKVEIAGQEYTIRFDWSCLAEIENEFGDNPNFFDPDTVSKIAAIGLKKYHPELTPEKLKELSPPLVPFANAVHDAMKFAYFGNEPITAEKKIVQEDLKRGGLWHHLKQRFGMGSAQ